MFNKPFSFGNSLPSFFFKPQTHTAPSSSPSVWYYSHSQQNFEQQARDFWHTIFELQADLKQFGHKNNFQHSQQTAITACANKIDPAILQPAVSNRQSAISQMKNQVVRELFHLAKELGMIDVSTRKSNIFAKLWFNRMGGNDKAKQIKEFNSIVSRHLGTDISHALHTDSSFRAATNIDHATELANTSHRFSPSSGR